MSNVLKKSGKEQKFNPTKIKKSVEKAAVDAGLALQKIGDLINQVAIPVVEIYKNKDAVKTSEIKKSLLRKLKKEAKEVLIAWEKYDKTKKKINKIFK